MRRALKRWSIPFGFLAAVVAAVCIYRPSMQTVVHANADGQKQAMARVGEVEVKIVQPPPTIKEFVMAAPNGWILRCRPDGSGTMVYGASMPPTQFKTGTIDFPAAVRRLRAARTAEGACPTHFMAGFRTEGERGGSESFYIKDSKFALAIFEKAARKETRLHDSGDLDLVWKWRSPGWYDEFTIETPQAPNHWWFRCERDGSGCVSYANSSTSFREGTIDFPATAKQLLKLMDEDGKARNGFRVMVFAEGVRRNGFIMDSKFILALFRKAARKEVSTKRDEYFDKFWKEEPPSFSRR